MVTSFYEASRCRPREVMFQQPAHDQTTKNQPSGSDHHVLRASPRRFQSYSRNASPNKHLNKSSSLYLFMNLQMVYVKTHDSLILGVSVKFYQIIPHVSGYAAENLEKAGFKSLAYITQGLQKVKPGIFEKEGPKELEDAGKAGLITVQGPVSAVIGAILIAAYLYLQFFPDQAEKLFFSK